MAKIIYVDVETTGTKHHKHGIHQIGMVVEVNGKFMEQNEWNVRPDERAQIDPNALAHCNVTAEQILSYPSRYQVIGQVRDMLSRYVDISDPQDKYIISGYNSGKFDAPFLESWFMQCMDVTWKDWFWNGTLDVLAIATFILQEKRHEFSSFSLSNVAKFLGIESDKSKLHSALYDAQLCMGVLKKLRTWQPKD